MMRYLVMECHPGYAVLLDEAGRFLKAANLRYEVGQTVYDPVLMKERSEKKGHIVRWVSSGVAAIAACLLLFFGFGYYQAYMQTYSSIYLSINPEVRMDLNRQGTVVGLAGTNEDGTLLLEGYDGRGKDKVTVADELIDRAIAMGFLSEGGRVTFSIDSPDDALFEAYGIELRTKVTEHLDGRVTVTIEILDYQAGWETPPAGSPSPTPTPTPSPTPTPTPTAPPASSGASDYDGSTSGYSDTDYGPANGGTVSSGGQSGSAANTPPPASSAPAPADTDYGPGNDGVTDYSDGNTDYDPDNDDDGGSNYGDDDNDDDGNDDGDDDD